MLDKSDWVWGYERLGDWFVMKILLAFVFLVIALVTLHFAFHVWWDITAIETGKALSNSQELRELPQSFSGFIHTLFLGL